MNNTFTRRHYVYKTLRVTDCRRDTADEARRPSDSGGPVLRGDAPRVYEHRRLSADHGNTHRASGQHHQPHNDQLTLPSEWTL